MKQIMEGWRHYLNEEVYVVPALREQGKPQAKPPAFADPAVEGDIASILDQADAAALEAFDKLESDEKKSSEEGEGSLNEVAFTAAIVAVLTTWAMAMAGPALIALLAKIGTYVHNKAVCPNIHTGEVDSRGRAEMEPDPACQPKILGWVEHVGEEVSKMIATGGIYQRLKKRWGPGGAHADPNKMKNLEIFVSLLILCITLGASYLELSKAAGETGQKIIPYILDAVKKVGVESNEARVMFGTFVQETLGASDEATSAPKYAAAVRSFLTTVARRLFASPGGP